jgi:voltage-gated potassium channel Kch
MRSRVLMMIFVAALAVSSLGIYLIEGGQGAPFDDLFNGVWWSFVTFTTVGYGDMSPATVPGKLFGIIVLLGGVFINSVVISLVSNWVFEYRSSQARGISDIDESEHALVCSDDPAFIRSVVGELRAKPVPTTPVVIFPGNENPLLTTDGSSPDWVSGPATSGEVLRKANVKRAAQAYVAYRDASQTVMTVMQIEALTDRRVQSLALYADRGFRVHLNDAGVDYALNVDRLYVPLMVQSFVNQGAPAWLRQLILETPDSAAMRTRRLAAGTWGDYFARRANDDEVPVGVLRGEELIPNPGWDFAVQDGDQALLMVGPEDRSARTARWSSSRTCGASWRPPWKSWRPPGRSPRSTCSPPCSPSPTCPRGSG